MKVRVFIFVALFLMLIAASVMCQDRRSRNRCSKNVRVVVVHQTHRSLVHKRYDRCRTEYYLKYKMNKPTRSKATYGKTKKKYPKIRRNKRSSSRYSVRRTR